MHKHQFLTRAFGLLLLVVCFQHLLKCPGIDCSKPVFHAHDHRYNPNQMTTGTTQITWQKVQPKSHEGTKNLMKDNMKVNSTLDPFLLTGISFLFKFRWLLCLTGGEKRSIHKLQQYYNFFSFKGHKVMIILTNNNNEGFLLRMYVCVFSLK